MDPVLSLLRQNARYSSDELAELAALLPGEIDEKIKAWEESGVIVGYSTIIDAEKAGDTRVSAFIEVKMTPERGGGFDSLARRIAGFSQVKSCYLISGGYDLLVVLEGSDIRGVASFVAEKLSTMKGILSTATHFQLKVYKQNGMLTTSEEVGERLAITP